LYIFTLDVTEITSQMAHLLAKSWEEWEFQRSRVATCIVTVPCASDSLLACAQPSTWQGKPKNVASHLHSKLCRRPCQPHVAFITATLLAHFIAHVHTAANADPKRAEAVLLAAHAATVAERRPAVAEAALRGVAAAADREPRDAKEAIDRVLAAVVKLQKVLVRRDM